MSERQRLDARLVSEGLASGREKAKELIADGQVQVNGKTVTKPSFAVSPQDTVISLQGEPRFVGRGGWKLEKALSLYHPSLDGMTAADIGSSTGGFTQCMLQHGAEKVFAVDVGRDQLHSVLRQDPRVVCMEQTDIRDTEKISQHIENGSLDFAATDVSFISLRLVVPSICALLKDGAPFVCLIKPQFEAGRKALDKHGVVRDVADHRRVLSEITLFLASCRLSVEHLDPSPVRGGDGNIEYLAVTRYHPQEEVLPLAETAIDQAILQAEQTLNFPKIGR